MQTLADGHAWQGRFDYWLRFGFVVINPIDHRLLTPLLRVVRSRGRVAQWRHAGEGPVP